MTQIHYAVFVGGRCIECTVCREFAEQIAKRTGGQIIEEEW